MDAHLRVAARTSIARLRIQVNVPLRKFQRCHRTRTVCKDAALRLPLRRLAPDRPYGATPAERNSSWVARMCHVPRSCAAASESRSFLAMTHTNLSSFCMIASAPILLRTRRTGSSSRRCSKSRLVPGGRSPKSGWSAGLITHTGSQNRTGVRRLLTAGSDDRNRHERGGYGRSK